MCNALYERELHVLSQQKINNISLLQRKIGGLRHHIKRAADQLLNHTGPLHVDVHNGAWQGKQAANCMSGKADASKTQLWYSKHARLGLCAPVHLIELGIEHIELDSIDRIDLENSRLHLNKHGWFNVSGDNTEPHSNSIHGLKKRLLKPSKATLTAACCGHTWNHRGRSQPRTLTLREMLLSGSVNWQSFT